MISYREKQLISVQKMLQDNTQLLLSDSIDMLNRNRVEIIGSDRFQEVETYEELTALAGFLGYSNYIRVCDILSSEELDEIDRRRKEIDAMFSKKTSIVNKVDLSFLAIATAIQVTKALIFPYIAKNFNYGENIDKTTRLDHNDSGIKSKQQAANEKFKNKYRKKYPANEWIEILYRTPPYDITKGSANLGINMGGKYHRMYTLGHDPILGWLFGTMNILTDTVTLNDFRTYRVIRKPSMLITPQSVSLIELLEDSYQATSAGKLNLPAAIFAQAQHLKSDAYTKLGLPVPLLSAINEDFASKLYKSNYDALCFARDIAVVGSSFIVSKIIDTIIGLVHGLFRDVDTDSDLYEVRTRKILLVSNSIASASTIINGVITSNVKNVDLGSLINTVIHLFTDVRFITKIKQEFIEKTIDEQFEEELRKMEDV